MTKLFITGGTGFWGKNLLKMILENTFYAEKFDHVIVLTRDSEAFLNKFPEFIAPKIEFINGDVRNFQSNINDFQYILHLATDASKDLNDYKPLEMMDVIINGTKNILEFAKNQKKLKKLVFASSGAVYGDIPEEIDGVKEEERFDLDFTNPLNAYAQAKRTAEMMCHIMIEKFQMPIIIARGFAFIGEYLPEDSHFAIGNFMKQAREEGKITIKSDGSAKRSYMKANELAKSLLGLMLAEKNNFETYNIGDDCGKTLKEWAIEIAKINGNVKVEILGEPQKGYSAGKNYVPNVDRLRSEIELIQIKKD